MPAILRYYILLLVSAGSVQVSAFESNDSSSSEHIVINEVLSSNSKSNYDNDFGAYSDWVELFNPSDSGIDLGGWYLSDNPANPGKWGIPDSTIIPKNGYLLFWADGRDLEPGQKAFVEFTEIHEILVSELHLNFKINSEFEEVLLYDENLELIDSVILTNQEKNYSYGRARGNPEVWSYLGEPTPLAANSNFSSDSYAIAESPVFSMAGGLYPEALVIELLATQPSALIKYTTDGSEPDSRSDTYSEPLPVNFSQVIKARVFIAGRLPGEAVTESFIIGKETELPVLSVSTDQKNLWGFDFGLYQNNFKNREVFAHLEYFDENGSKEFKINAGLQLFGSQIFLFDQKPFSIFFRNRYGRDTLNYRLFKNKEISTYHSLVLRNGGNDNNLTMFRDGLGAALVENQMDIDYQSYLPVVVYMNGEYWGIFNLREKLNKDYLGTNHQVNPAYVDVIEDSLKVNDGDANSYSDLIDYIKHNDLSQELHFNYVSGKMDINEFINYMSYKIYGGYKQWQVNSKYWRERTPGSVWRWIAFDLEHCFGGPGGENYDSNTFLSALESGNGSTDWYTLLFRKLMENENFRAEFIQRTALYLNTVFNKRRVLSIIDSLQNNIINEMEDHITRWESPVSKAAWLQYSNFLKEFAGNRNQYMFQHLLDYFNIPDTSRLTLKRSTGGKVLVCSSYILEHDSATFTMCNNIPVSLVALPEPGYVFSGWNSSDLHEKIQLVFNNDTSLFAFFEKTDQNIIPDTISGKLILQDTQLPWISSGNIIIPTGDSLIIREGVKLLMTPGGSLINYGYLKIEGTEANPVIFDINSNITDRYYRSTPKKWGAICILSSDSTQILNTVLENASSGLAQGKFRGAISAAGSKMHLKGVTIHGVMNPIYCYKSEVIIDSCSLSSNGTGDLINLRACSDPVIRNNNLKGNFYEDTDAIDLDSVDHAIIEGNVIYSFFGSNSDGIDLGESSRDIVILNNTILSCSDKGISVGQGSEVEVTGNLIVDCNQGFGIKDFNSFARINQNTLYNNVTGIACFEKNPGNGGGSAEVENTIIAGSVDRSVFVDNLSSITVSYCISDRDTLLGYNNLFGSPLFAAASNHSFWLKPGSPCINTGNPNLQDPDGSRADIGAFILEKGPASQEILFSEINFNAHPSYSAGDWIELYNGGLEQVDLSGWTIKGENPDDEYIFPDNLHLSPGGYLVIAENSDSVEWLYGHSINLVGDFGFGLNRDGELIKLYDRDYQLVHSLQYSSEFPWPDGADGKGATIELYYGESDNSHTENWHASYIRGGTPGEQNSVTVPVLGLYINEFMAKNDQAYADESGEYDDWVEIYNANNFDVDLGGLNFRYGDSDKLLSMIPFNNQDASTIEANGYKLFWADKDPEQGVLHLDFNLPASGGTLGLAQIIEKQIQMIDQIDYSEQMADAAFGRYPDGDKYLSGLYLTPGYSNLLLNISDHKGVKTGFLVYPNPADQHFYIKHEFLKNPSVVELRNLNGAIVQEFVMKPAENTRIDVSGLLPGIYILQVRGEENMVEKVIIY